MGVVGFVKGFPLSFDKNNVLILTNSGHVLLESENENVWLSRQFLFNNTKRGITI